jgi:integrase
MAAKYTTDKQISSLKIYPTGYYIHCRINGKRREKKIAPRNVLINIARKEAQKILGLIAQGIDPFEEKKKKQKADEYTVDKMWDNYIKSLQHKNQETKTKENIYIKNIQPFFGNTTASKVNKSDLVQWFQELTKRSPTVANKCLVFLKAAYYYSIDVLELLDKNPTKKISKNYEEARSRYYTDEEKKAIFIELARRYEEDPSLIYSVSKIGLQFFTGARGDEISKAKWKHLVQDERGNRIELPVLDHKTGLKTNKKRVIWLNDQAMKIIYKLNNLTNKSEDSTIVKVKSVRKIWNKTREVCGCPDLQLHDLRHSYASTAINSGKMSTKEVGTLLGHTSLASMDRYMHIYDQTSTTNASLVGNAIDDGSVKLIN